MATKSETRTAITQLTATGNSDEVDVAGSFETEAHIRHVNGTGTITAAATVGVQYNTEEASGTWKTLHTITFGTTASATEDRFVRMPSGAKRVRLAYTAPAGSTGHTLDADVTEVTIA